MDKKNHNNLNSMNEGISQNLKANQIYFLPQSGQNPSTLFQNSHGQVLQVKPGLNIGNVPTGAILYKQSSSGQLQAINSPQDHMNTISKVNTLQNKNDQKTVLISNQPFVSSGSNTTYVYAIPASSLAKSQGNSLGNKNPQTISSNKGQVIHAPVGSLLLHPSNPSGFSTNTIGTLRNNSNPNPSNRSVIPYIINSNGQPTFLSLAQLNQMNIATKPNRTVDVSETNKAPVLNKTPLPSCPSNTCTNQNQVLCTCPSSFHDVDQCPEEVSISSIEEPNDRPEKESEGETRNQVPQSHVNYLIKLFQALQNSGVKQESFITAFKNMNIPMHPSNASFEGDELKEVLSRSLDELTSLKEEITFLKDHHHKAVKSFEKNMKILNFKLINKMRQIQTAARNKVMCPLLEPQIQQVRADRLRLDRITSEFHGKRMNTVGQLSDLEGVLEEVVDEMLKGRCSLNSDFVDSLELRLQHATNSILLCNERLPSLIQMQSRQVEIEASANDYEKQSMDRQVKQLEELKEKCKKLSDTIITFKKLVEMQSTGGLSERRERKLNVVKAYFANRKDAKFDRSKLLSRINLIQPDSDDRMRKIELQEALLKRRRRVLLDIPNLSNNDLTKTKNFLAANPRASNNSENMYNSHSGVDASASSSSSDDEEEEKNKKRESYDNNFVKAAMNASLKSPVVPILRESKSKSVTSVAEGTRTNRVMFATQVQCNLKGLDLKLNCLGEDHEYFHLEKIPTTDFHEGGGSMGSPQVLEEKLEFKKVLTSVA